MAIEIQTQSVQNSILGANNQSSSKLYKSGNTLQDQILGLGKEDDKKETDKKDSDKVTLSPQAQALLNGVNTSNDNETSARFSQDSLERQALAFRGLAQIAQRRELNETEVDQVRSIRANFAEAGINDAGILKLAEKKLVEVQTQTTDLVQLLNSGDITGGQYKQLNQINKLLNNTNGFGSEQVEGALQVRAEQLTKAFDEVTSATENKKLAPSILSTLEQLQKELSTIQGYQLNVRDSVGPDGVVI